MEGANPGASPANEAGVPLDGKKERDRALPKRNHFGIRTGIGDTET